jgi:hypothetical protein
MVPVSCRLDFSDKLGRVAAVVDAVDLLMASRDIWGDVGIAASAVGWRQGTGRAVGVAVGCKGGADRE